MICRVIQEIIHLLKLVDLLNSPLAKARGLSHTGGQIMDNYYIHVFVSGNS